VVKRAALVLLGALAMASVFGTVALASTPGDRAGYPRTGTQIAIFAVVVVIILVGGIMLWYFSHPRKRK
jgi:ABC-type methionine transport system permease subunit